MKWLGALALRQQMCQELRELPSRDFVVRQLKCEKPGQL
jgi:hypothetical protein